MVLVGVAVLVAACTESTGPHNEFPPIVSVDLSTKSASLYAGTTLQLIATAKDAQGNALGAHITWTSSDGSLVSVGSDGVVRALAYGSATVTAASDGGPTASATISVLHDPIIFVHGFESSGAIWTTMIDRLKADGWTDAPLVTWTYDTHISNVTTAQLLQAKTDSLLTVTGAKKIDIIAHSMGGLSSRYFAKNLGGSEKIDALVFLATPNHGTTLANFCGIQSCLEMRPTSAFLANLNSGDETPGSARYATWWTPCDQAVTPPDSPVLAGATNTETACMSHTDLYIDAAVYAQVRNWIR